MMSSRGRLGIFFLSYDRGIHWILEIGGDIGKIGEKIEDIASSRMRKYVMYRDGDVGIWRDVYEEEDMFGYIRYLSSSGEEQRRPGPWCADSLSTRLAID